MSEPYLGEIRMFAGTFAPINWALCQGQTMSIAQNTALFSLVGTYYGGNGVTTFCLPDMRSRIPVHQGQVAGGSPYSMGEMSGAEQVTLMTTQMPAHNHPALAQTAASQTTPLGNLWSTSSHNVYGPNTSANTTMAPYALSYDGSSLPHNNLPNYVGVTYIIALQGIYPSRT